MSRDIKADQAPETDEWNDVPVTQGAAPSKNERLLIAAGICSMIVCGLFVTLAAPLLYLSSSYYPFFSHQGENSIVRLSAPDDPDKWVEYTSVARPGECRARNYLTNGDMFPIGQKTPPTGIHGLLVTLGEKINVWNGSAVRCNPQEVTIPSSEAEDSLWRIAESTTEVVLAQTAKRVPDNTPFHPEELTSGRTPGYTFFKGDGMPGGYAMYAASERLMPKSYDVNEDGTLTGTSTGVKCMVVYNDERLSVDKYTEACAEVAKAGGK